MAFRLNRTLNRKSDPKLDDLVEVSPYMKHLHSRRKGINASLLDAYKEQNSYGVSSKLVSKGLKVVAVGFTIVSCVFYMSMRKDVALTTARKEADTTKEKREGAVLLSQKLAGDHS